MTAKKPKKTAKKKTAKKTAPKKPKKVETRAVSPFSDFFPGVFEDPWFSDPFSRMAKMHEVFSGFKGLKTSDKEFRVDVSTTKKEVKVVAQIPGVDPKDVHIDVTEDAISIRGDWKKEKEQKDKKFFKKECSSGSFHRSFMLPAKVNPNKTKAKTKDGVLIITLPRIAEEKKQNKIEIQAG